MAKAIFFNVPGHGHINPSLPLVRELVLNGHEITYFATELFRAQIEATGAAVQIYPEVEDDYFEKRSLHGGVPQKVACSLLTTTEALLPYLLDTTRKIEPHYILYDGMCPWGYFVAQRLALPSVVSLALIPISPRAILDWRILRLIPPMILRETGNGIKANRLSQALGKSYNVRPLSMAEFLDVPGSLRLSYSIPDLVPFADTLPDNLHFVGWTMPGSVTDDPDVDNRKRKRIYISLGTVNNNDAPFFKACITAFTDTDYSVLITTGHRFSEEDFGLLPENIVVKQWVSQEQAIRQADLFINHGGVNSIYDSLYCGVPLFLIPQTIEQTFNALQVVDSGAGLSLKRSRLNAGVMRRNAEQILNDNQFHDAAKRIGKSLRDETRMSAAINEIENLIS